jgi:hypothetical protein
VQEKTTQGSKTFRVFNKKDPSLVDAPVLSVGRYVIGRAESCDIVLKSRLVSSIHAVLEVTPGKCRLFDMNSRNGCYVNGKKEIVKDIKPGDNLKCADVEFVYDRYKQEDILPPVMSSIPQTKVKPDVPKELPKDIPEVADDVPYIVYPLSLDPNADQSEYIFEDSDELYPIFKYEYNKQAIEVITLYDDRVYNVDYISNKDGKYYLKGYNPGKNTIEMPALGAKEKLDFIEVQTGNCLVHNLPGFELLHLENDKLVSRDENTINLQGEDIITLRKGDIEIFLRRVPNPPMVKEPPFFRLEKGLKRTIAFILLLIFLILTAFNLFEVDEEMKKEKNPERVATILYKRKLIVNKTKAIEKTKKKVVKKQAAKKKTVIKKSQKKSDQQKIKTITKKKVVPKDPGKKSAKKKVVQKKVKNPIKRAKTIGSPKKSTRKVVRAKTQRAVVSKAKGHVDVYKSFNFKSTVSALVAKGGKLKGANVKAAKSTSDFEATNIGGGVSDVKSANVNQKIGSLTGAATGKIADSKGAEGLSAKTSIATAGIPSETVVLGSMDPDVIRSILREHLPQFRYCYQRALDRSASDVSGVVKMNFIIGASGHVSRAGVQNTASRVPGSVKKCMVNVLKGIKFPAPLGGGKVEVNQPFNLYPKRS